MTPPRPPPPRAEQAGPPPPMPRYLQTMMREMQQKQPQWQQTQQMGRERGRGGGRYGGRGRGRGGLPPHRKRLNARDDQVQYNRKRGPSDDGHDASRFFLPSFLGDPWKELEAGKDRGPQAVEETKKHGKLPSRMETEPRHGAGKDGRGHVLFQPSFVDDPWVRVYN